VYVAPLIRSKRRTHGTRKRRREKKRKKRKRERREGGGEREIERDSLKKTELYNSGSG